MDTHFASLCELLEDEAERQETLLALLQSQRRAMAEQDIACLENRTEAVRALIVEAAQAQTKRHRVLNELVKALNLTASEQTLSELIARAPAPFNRRLHDVQTRLQTALGHSKDVVRGNAVTLRSALSFVNDCLAAVQGDRKERGYDRGGRELTGLATEPAFLNRRG